MHMKITTTSKQFTTDMYYIYTHIFMVLPYAVNDEKLGGLKFGESANKCLAEESKLNSSRIMSIYGN